MSCSIDSVQQGLTFGLEAYGVQLKPLQTTDLDVVRLWRNHPRVSGFMLNQKAISEQDQQAWFNRINKDNSQKHYMVFYRNKAIGVINIKALKAEPLTQARAVEVGFYLEPDCRYRGTVLAFCPAMAINDFCFERLGCHHLQATVLEDNEKAIRFNEQLGYRCVEQKKGIITMIMDSAGHKKALANLKKVIRV